VKVTRIKTIFIWALVLINLFFLAVVLRGLHLEGSGKNDALNDLSRLFGASGVTLDVKNIHEGTTLQDYTAGRDPAAEKAMAEAILGPAVKSDEGGMIIDYTGNNGSTAEFRSGGNIKVTLKPGTWLAGAGATSTADGILRTLKIETVSVTKTGDNGDETVAVVCAAAGQPIFNCSLDFKFKDGQFLGFSGTLPTVLTPGVGKTDVSSAATVLIRFLSDVKSGKIDCTRIDAVEPGYYLTPYLTDNGSLTAVWRIETDNGIFYRDAVSGKQVGA
jgi:hypothetical protein